MAPRHPQVEVGGLVTANTPAVRAPGTAPPQPGTALAGAGDVARGKCLVVGVRVMRYDRREVGETRRWIRDRLAKEITEPSAGLASAIDDLLTCASELTGNAVLHAPHRPDDVITICLLLEPGALRVEVSDAGGWCGRLPRADDPGGAAESGRGLAIVAHLSASWGWFETMRRQNRVVPDRGRLPR